MGRSWDLTRGFRGKVFLTMFVAFLLLLVPGIALVLTVLATSLLGDAWRDRLAGDRAST